MNAANMTLQIAKLQKLRGVHPASTANHLTGQLKRCEAARHTPRSHNYSSYSTAIHHGAQGFSQKQQLNALAIGTEKESATSWRSSASE